MPRVKDRDGKVRTVEVPWARSGSGFTIDFEARPIALMRQMPVYAAARELKGARHAPLEDPSCSFGAGAAGYGYRQSHPDRGRRDLGQTQPRLHHRLRRSEMRRVL